MTRLPNGRRVVRIFVVASVSALLLPTTTSCSPARLSTEDTCIELSTLVDGPFDVNTLPLEDDGEGLLELSQRSSEVLADELLLLGEVTKGSPEQREQWFFIDAQYEAVDQAVTTLSRACR